MKVYPGKIQEGSGKKRRVWPGLLLIVLIGGFMGKGRGVSAQEGLQPIYGFLEYALGSSVNPAGNTRNHFGPKALEGGNGTSLMDVQEPSKRIENSEIALRLRRNIKSTELALYGYYGLYKRPLGDDYDWS